MNRGNKINENSNFDLRVKRVNDYNDYKFSGLSCLLGDLHLNHPRSHCVHIILFAPLESLDNGQLFLILLLMWIGRTSLPPSA